MGKRPHIILLMADHLRFDCLAYSGRKIGVQTPHLDALAEESVVFEHAYCSTPLCIPTRTSIATGKWPHTTGAIVNGPVVFRTIGPEHRTVYEQLVENGYRLTLTGRQHVFTIPPLEERMPSADINRDVNWEEHLRARGFAPPRCDDERVPRPEYRNGRADIRFTTRPGFVRRTEFDAEHFLDVFWANRMVEKIKAANPASPHAWFFFAWAPHPPFFVPDPYFSMYDPGNIELPENVGRWYQGQPPHLLHGTGAYGCTMLRDEWRPTWAAYFGLVTMVDQAIGRVIASLRRQGFWEDALVIFVQDTASALALTHSTRSSTCTKSPHMCL